MLQLSGRSSPPKALGRRVWESGRQLDAVWHHEAIGARRRAFGMRAVVAGALDRCILPEQTSGKGSFRRQRRRSCE
jgi:hypothetical protein